MKKIFILVALALLTTGCTVRDNLSLLTALAVENTAGSEQVAGYYFVTRVVDGDTIDVKINGRIERVRLIGIDSPESVDPKRPAGCFGKEAAEAARAKLLHQLVRLEADKTQADKDRYGRLLRYVTTKEGYFANLELIRAGNAFEFTFKAPYQFQSQFKTAQLSAQAKKLGLWSESACAKQYQASAIQAKCDIKGNIDSRKAKIYLLPTCPDYKKAVINQRTGERYFCSEVEAIKAGFSRSRNCK